MSNNERILKEDMILQCQEAFTQLDHNNSGLVGTKDLGNLLRALGINPTNEELQVKINYSTRGRNKAALDPSSRNKSWNIQTLPAMYRLQTAPY